ncbi:MAG: hypothetical protein EPO08_00745 [Rhodospirillaceae bacterium]|nr:MAG: hypothetical protein EPO08_00745 [Rhodospirillaceae bacterium]
MALLSSLLPFLGLLLKVGGIGLVYVLGGQKAEGNEAEKSLADIQAADAIHDRVVSDRAYDDSVRARFTRPAILRDVPAGLPGQH